MVYHPEQIINRYVWEQFKTYAPSFYRLYEPTSTGNTIIPFYPAGQQLASSIEDDRPYVIFDKFTRVRAASNRNIHSIKTDQMRYTIHGGYMYDVSAYNRDRYAATIDLTSLIFKILDRHDDAAKDINDFAITLPGYADSPDMFKYFFHSVEVFQSGFAENQQDVSDLMEYNPSRDLIIKYDYHSKQFNE